jgi:hypothetical protein
VERNASYSAESVAQGGAKITIVPMDLTTSFGEAPIEVHLPPGDGPLLDRLAASVQLRTWPELEPVDVAVEKVEYSYGTDLANRPFVPFPLIRIKPRTKLDDRWYVASVLPPAGTHMSDMGYIQLSDSGYGSRFRPGSQLTVRDIRRTIDNTEEHIVGTVRDEKIVDNTEEYIVVEFSERVYVKDRAKVWLSATASNDQCTLIDGGSISSGGGVLTLAFSCGRGRLVENLRLELAGIIGVSGAELTPVPPAIKVVDEIHIQEGAVDTEVVRPLYK